MKAQEVNPGLDRLEEVHHSSDLGDVNALMSTGDPRAFKSSHQLLTEEYHQHQVCKLSLISTFRSAAFKHLDHLFIIHKTSFALSPFTFCNE